MIPNDVDSAIHQAITVDGKYYLRFPDGEHELVTGGGHAFEFPPGWEPEFLYSGFNPLYLLALRHASGGESTWFLDQNMTRIGFDEPEQLPPTAAGLLRIKAWGVLRELEREPAQVTAEVEGFMRLGSEIRRRIRQFCEAGDASDDGDLSDDSPLHALFAAHNGAAFLTPSDLSVTAGAPRRVALIGSCLLGDLDFHQSNPSGCTVDLLVVNNAESLADRLPAGVEISSYDLAIVQIPLRAIVLDGMFAHLAYGSIDAYEQAFQEACERLRFQLRSRMEWNEQRGTLTFVANFFVPQRNPMGALFPRFDLRNPEYFIARLNEELESLVLANRGAYVLDVDRISASIGRRHIQDDIVAITGHGSMMSLPGVVPTRIEPLQPMMSYYDIRWPRIFRGAVWAELISMYRVVRQVDSVKLVVVDLDDTLWHGVSGDILDIGPDMAEGWPLGLAEALSYLKKRGILLAIISKNDEQRIRSIWPKIFGDRLSLEDFASVVINWDPKPENMRALLEVTNLLPRNVVFIDDNPAERAAMRRVYPDMRVLGRHPYYLRRILLWSSETQVASITGESGRRTEMMKRQVVREARRKHLSRDEFLREAAPRVTMMTIEGMDHPRFARAFELLNKTNQYNTTGRRWTAEECRTMLRSGATLYTFEVVDKYTDYGLVGVVIVAGFTIEQWVMSCRVLGYQIEDAVMSVIVGSLRAKGSAPIIGRLIERDVNFPCRALFSKCGFTHDGEWWLLAGHQTVAMPDHVTLAEFAAAQ